MKNKNQIIIPFCVTLVVFSPVFLETIFYYLAQITYLEVLQVFNFQKF